MAGDWIKIELVTPDKPEIDMIAEILDVSVNEVIGGLVRLWIWADNQTIDGNARSVTKKAIDRHSGVSNLAQAMLDERVGWLIEREDGGFSFPNFDRHNGKTAKNRALTAKRVAKHREKDCNDESVTDALAREEKRREEKEKRKNTNTPLPPLQIEDLPENLQMDSFITCWREWENHRKESKAKLTDTTRKRQLSKCARLGPLASIRMINRSIENGWKGLFEEGESKPATSPPSSNGNGSHRPLSTYERNGAPPGRPPL